MHDAPDDPRLSGEAEPIPGEFPYDLDHQSGTQDGWDIETVAGIDGSIVEWLQRLSTDWQHFDFPGLDDHAKAVIHCLTWARLVEQQFALNIKLADGTAAHRPCILSGDFHETLADRLDALQPGWKEWELADARDIRLTAEGVKAKADLADPILQGHTLAYVRGWTPHSLPRKCPGTVQLSPGEAHHEKLFPKGLPDDLDLRDAVLLLATERTPKNTDRELLRKLTSESVSDCPKAKRLESKIRKARLDGRTTLSKRTERTERTGSQN
jgi:hypothetical protein